MILTLLLAAIQSPHFFPYLLPFLSGLLAPVVTEWAKDFYGRKNKKRKR